MNKIFIIAIFSLLLAACTSNTIIEKPDNLISKKEMVNLLSDMIMAQGAENIKNLNLERNVNYFPLVFEKYKVDSTQFYESNYYYISKIDDYDDILKKVEARLTTIKMQLDEERKIQDSIKGIKNTYPKNRRREIIE